MLSTFPEHSKQFANPFSVRINVNIKEAWSSWQSRHGTNGSCYMGVDKTCTNTSMHVSNWDHKSSWTTFVCWVVWERKVALSHTDGKLVKTKGFVLVDAGFSVLLQISQSHRLCTLCRTKLWFSPLERVRGYRGIGSHSSAVLLSSLLQPDQQLQHLLGRRKLKVQ